MQGAAGADAIGLAETRCIPKLCRKIAIAFNAAFIHLHIPALAFHGRHEETQGVGSILIHQDQRIDDITLGFGHFLSVGRADKAVEIERLPRHFLHEVHSLHRHARIPKEEDVKAGDENVVGVVALQIFGLVGPAQRPKRPECGGEPCIKHVFVAGQRSAFARLRLRGSFVFGDINLAIGVIPSRDPVPPPKLARHAPGLDILHPVKEGLFPCLGDDIDPAVANRL